MAGADSMSLSSPPRTPRGSSHDPYDSRPAKKVIIGAATMARGAVAVAGAFRFAPRPSAPAAPRIAQRKLDLNRLTFPETKSRCGSPKPRLTWIGKRIARCLLHSNRSSASRLAPSTSKGSPGYTARSTSERLAVPENEHEWLTVAQGRSVRQIEELVKGHRLGDRPGAPPSSSRHVLRFEVLAETVSTFRESNFTAGFVGAASSML
jgi:hypothetical protein